MFWVYEWIMHDRLRTITDLETHGPGFLVLRSTIESCYILVISSVTL